MAAPKIIFFDYDGVLVDAAQIVWEAFLNLKHRYRMHPFGSKEELLAHTQRTVWRTLLAMGVPLWQLPLALYDIRRFISKSYTPSLVRGMPDLIARLQKQYVLIVVSSNFHAVVQRTLKTSGLNKFFAEIICTNLSGHKRAVLKRALERWRVHPQETVLVTDTEGDVRDATSLGIPAVGVTWGFHTRQRLINAGAHGVATRPSELPRVIAHG